MKDLLVRFIENSDLEFCMNMDASYHTEFVWQMEVLNEDNKLDVSFREIKLPRSMHVEYPRTNEQIIEAFRKREAVLVGAANGNLIGYLSVLINQGNAFAQVTDLVISRRYRRQGAGSKLIRSAQQWSLENGFHQLQLEMQSKNFPAIELAGSLGYEFCGYSDRYYQNQDIALFFNKRF